jgi:hypothetical protein
MAKGQASRVPGARFSPFQLQPCSSGDLLEPRPLRPDDDDQLYAVALFSHSDAPRRVT